MKVTGIIAEYNPFHRGHKYQIDYCKKELGISEEEMHSCYRKAARIISDRIGTGTVADRGIRIRKDKNDLYSHCLSGHRRKKQQPFYI